MPERVRVLQVITKLALGGAQETVLGLCAGLDPDRFDVRVLCGPERDAEGDLRDQFDAAGVRIEFVESMGRSVRAVGDARALAAMTSAVRRIRPEIVHTHTSKAGALGRLAARLVGVGAVVHTVHGWSFDHRGGGYSAPMIEAERLLARLCHRLVVVTPADEEKGRQHRIGRPDQYRLIRSGIDVDAFRNDPDRRSSIRARLDIPPESVVVGTVGRLSEQKDPLTLLAAFSRIAYVHPAARLLIVGDGPLRSEVDRAVVDLGIGGRVDLVGAQHDPASWLAAMDVFALSSRWEGLPRAALEAAASGLPIVSTRCGGMAELAARGAAVLCDVNDADALAALVEEAIEARPASRDAPAWIHEFSATEMVDKTALLYDELVPARLTV